jgi:hypothetical protein
VRLPVTRLQSTDDGGIRSGFAGHKSAHPRSSHQGRTGVASGTLAAYAHCVPMNAVRLGYSQT